MCCRHLGYIAKQDAAAFAAQIRHMKVTKQAGLPAVLEIALVSESFKSQYPGIYLFTAAARFLRPVKYGLDGFLDICSRR